MKGTAKINELLSRNEYPGRGIIAGESADGKSALIAYFIMGRSENSRNRVFERTERGLRTKAFVESKLVDPSLIIYNPYLKSGDSDVVTNGDQTDTIFDYIEKNGDDGFAFEKALHLREFEPDAPNFTPRISAQLYYSFNGGTFRYKLSTLKSSDGNPEACDRFFYSYSPRRGIGHFIHTYEGDGNPLPSFAGEPERVAMPSSAKELAETVWGALNEQNKVSLFVREVPLDGGEPTEIIINKNK